MEENPVESLIDPDADLELRSEVVASLEEYLASNRRGENADDVFRSLGLIDPGDEDECSIITVEDEP